MIKIKNGKIYGLSIIALVIIFVLSWYFFGHRKYKDAVLGISIAVPLDWHIEKGERVHFLKISPNNIQNADEYGVITVLGVADYGENLFDSVETEIARVEQISSPYEVIISQEAEEFKADEYEAVRTKLIIRSQPEDSEQSESEFDQLMELIIIRGHNQLVVLQVRKSQTDDAFNAQIDEIIDSIKLID